jgi:hypothetical protein
VVSQPTCHAEEDSTGLPYSQATTAPTRPDDKSIYLSTVFLSNRARVDPSRRTLAYAMTIAVKVPDYQVERKFWADEHYEGKPCP